MYHTYSASRTRRHVGRVPSSAWCPSDATRRISGFAATMNTARAERASHYAFFGVGAPLRRRATVTVPGAGVHVGDGEALPMPGGWTMSMAWMRMPGTALTSRRDIKPRHVGRDDVSDDAAIPWIPALSASPTRRRRDRRDYHLGLADHPHGRRLLFHLDPDRTCPPSSSAPPSRLSRWSGAPSPAPHRRRRCSHPRRRSCAVHRMQGPPPCGVYAGRWRPGCALPPTDVIMTRSFHA